MGDPSWRPIMELLRNRKMPCIIDLSWWYADMPWFAPSVYQKFETYTEYVQGLNSLVSDFPEVKIQLAHYGTPSLDGSGPDLQYERLQEPIELIKAHDSLSCDLAAYQHTIRSGDPYPYERALKIVEILVEGIGADRIQWGTDWPYLGQQPYPNVIRAIQEAPFRSNEASENLLSLNAVRFLQS